MSLPALLDVNALIALVDSDHVSHEAMRRWFTSHHASGWATCPLTENGMVRVLSQPSYPSGRRSPAEAVAVLNELKDAFGDSHRFFADDLTLTDTDVFESTLLAGPGQVTDAYLLALAMRHAATLVSFDRSLPIAAVRGATARRVTLPG